MQSSSGMRKALFAVVEQSREVGFADEYQLLEENCFSCCFAEGLGRRSHFRNLTV